MTTAATVTAIQTVNAAITGVTSAPTTMPSSLTTAALPLAITIPGPAEWQNNSAGWGYQFRTYYVRVYVCPIARDIPADGGFQDAMTLIQRFGDAYMEDTTMGGVVNTVRLDDGYGPPITDGGVRGDMTWGSDPNQTPYWGFEFQIITKEDETW